MVWYALHNLFSGNTVGQPAACTRAIFYLDSMWTDLCASFLIKRGVVGDPTALLTVQPECIHAQTFFEVKHPASTDVNDRGTHAWNQSQHIHAQTFFEVKHPASANVNDRGTHAWNCLLYTSPSPRD